MARGARLSTTGHHTINRCLLVALLLTGLNACGDTSEPEAVAVSLQVDVRGWGDVEPRLGTYDVGQSVTLTATPRAGTVPTGRESSKADGGAAKTHPPPPPQPRPPPPSSSGARRGAVVTLWGAWVLASALGLVLWAGREAYRHHVQRRKEKKCDHFNKVL